ncbi:hypothetical protein [Ectobacillus sp. sgz5001026]|uniref:hypothetical protein n=1 Tax=Ectobacillus sp. sgz5001026 TaxID=3242473 RepID=UPI0036D28B1F
MEMLASLSILLVICTLIVPQTMLLLKEARHTKMRHIANEIIREELVLMHNETSQDFSIEKEGVMYFIQIENSYEDSDKRICVNWFDANQQNQSRCERVRNS